MTERAPSHEMAQDRIPLRPLGSLKRFINSPVQAFQRKATGADPFYPERATFPYAQTVRHMTSSVCYFMSLETFLALSSTSPNSLKNSYDLSVGSMITPRAAVGYTSFLSALW